MISWLISNRYRDTVDGSIFALYIGDNVIIGDNALSRISTWQFDCWKEFVTKMTAERSFSGAHPRGLSILDVENCSSTHCYRANVLKTYPGHN